MTTRHRRGAMFARLLQFLLLAAGLAGAVAAMAHGVLGAAIYAGVMLVLLWGLLWLGRRHRPPVLKPGIGFVRPRHGK